IRVQFTADGTGLLTIDRGGAVKRWRAEPQSVGKQYAAPPPPPKTYPEFRPPKGPPGPDPKGPPAGTSLRSRSPTCPSRSPSRRPPAPAGTSPRPPLGGRVAPSYRPGCGS